MNSLALQNESESKWKIDSSFKYDLLCFVNILTGNDFYAKRFPNEFTMFHEKLSDSELKALENIDREIRIENKGIISAMLCLYFSAVPDLTFDQIIERFENFNLMKTNLQIAGYYSEDSWNSFISIKDDLKVVIEFLRDNGFLEYWSSNCKPLIDQRIKEVSNITDNFDIFVEVERITKIKKEPIPIEIFFLKFAKPHGMRIVGSAFITDISWDNKITLRTAVHEMLHGNIDWESENMKQVIEILNEDDFVMDKVKNHNPAFGYNTLEGYLEENCVRAMDQIINERFNISEDAKTRWKENDDGMHVFAAALYYVMKQKQFYDSGVGITEFLYNEVTGGELTKGNIVKVYNEFYGD